MPSRDVIRGLQETLLQAVLSGRPLPGQDGPATMPDLEFVLREPVVYLAAENLAGPVEPGDVGKPLRTLSLDALRTQARQQADVAYLYFQPAEVKADEVRLTLESRIAARDPGKQTLGLGAVHVRFVKAGGTWKAADPPVQSAS